MKIVSDEIKDILINEITSLVFGRNLFIGFEPPNPDNCVTIYDTGGAGLDLSYDRSERYYRATFQVRIRNNSYVDGLELANRAMETLHGRGHEQWGDAIYELIQCTSGPAFIGRDEHDRMVFVVNFEVQRRDV